MLPDRVSNPGPLTYESGALPIALRGSAIILIFNCLIKVIHIPKFEYFFLVTLRRKAKIRN